MVVPLIPSKTGWAQLKSGEHQKNFFGALLPPLCPSTFKILPAPVPSSAVLTYTSDALLAGVRLDNQKWLLSEPAAFIAAISFASLANF